MLFNFLRAGDQGSLSVPFQGRRLAYRQLATSRNPVPPALKTGPQTSQPTQSPFDSPRLQVSSEAPRRPTD
jgi:hypothetical protein